MLCQRDSETFLLQTKTQILFYGVSIYCLSKVVGRFRGIYVSEGFPEGFGCPLRVPRTLRDFSALGKRDVFPSLTSMRLPAGLKFDLGKRKVIFPGHISDISQWWEVPKTLAVPKIICVKMDFVDDVSLSSRNKRGWGKETSLLAERLWPGKCSRLHFGISSVIRSTCGREMRSYRC